MLTFDLCHLLILFQNCAKVDVIFMSITHNFRAAAVSQWIRALARPATQVVINRYWQLHCQTLGNRCECHGSTEMTIINGCPLSQYVWHAKELSLLNGHECWAKVKICSPSPVMVTSPYAYSSQCNGAQHYDMPFQETGKLRYLHVWGFFSFKQHKTNTVLDVWKFAFETIM